MALTTLAFLALTVLLVRRHLRTPGARPARPECAVRACPRCGAEVAPEALRCSACGVPVSAYELVGAPEAATDAGGPARGADPRPHAVVRADLCVGCGTCVDACPEPGAVRLEGKTAIVDRDLCMGHGRCADACPVGGIVVATGDAVQRVEVPQLDPRFQSNVPGVYIVGELGGRGLIKNAINEGKIAVEAIARDLLARGAISEAGDAYDLVVVGSGPAGISAGLEALRSGLRYVVLEQGTVADSIRRYPRHKLLLAEPVTMPLYGDLWIADVSKEDLLEVWQSVIAHTGLDVRTGQRVTDVTRAGELLLVATAGGQTFGARRVVLAMGRRGTPRRLGVPGEDRPKVVYDVAEMEVFRGRHVLVVGGGDSAVESALGLANQHGTDVTLCYRGTEFARVKPRNLEKLDAAVRRKRVRVALRSEVREILPEAVVLDVADRRETLPNDDVIVRIGGDAPYPFLQHIGVRLVKKDVPLSGEPKAAHA